MTGNGNQARYMWVQARTWHRIGAGAHKRADHVLERDVGVAVVRPLDEPLPDLQREPLSQQTSAASARHLRELSKQHNIRWCGEYLCCLLHAC